MTDSTADRLAEPFAPEMLRSLNKGGTSLTYVPGPEVTHRLNEVLGPCGWSYEILERWAGGEKETDSGVWPTACMAHVRLYVTIDETTAHKDGIGGQAVKFLNNNIGPVDIGDEWKGAVTDALKKAAQQFEVGLDIARKDEAKNAELAQEAAVEAARTLTAGGWASTDEYNERLAGLKARARALDADAKATLASWWTEQQFKGALSTVQADMYEEAIAGLEPAPTRAREKAQPNEGEAHPATDGTADESVSSGPDPLDQLAASTR